MVLARICIFATYALTPIVRGDCFATSGARSGRVFMRLRQETGAIELSHMRLRRSGRRFGPLILRAQLRGIARRQLVVRPLRPRTCLSRCRVFLLGQRGSERGGKKLFAGNQRGNEERPGQETEGAGSLISTLHSGFENLPLLFEQFALFYLVHDRRLS
ncbi:hypothetical protein [Bradyrhizobium sp. 187]|uniref:hypothetical protein n=1 Tax=unclassified Bradyrhizobium TaxID=2631580 RepID=UPI002000506E|nr:hypothetical protein [Bradyrhizobium sp. 187]UPJ74502.1 hypothetical protein IVB19_08200 [Bradyrhizobium sp. 187]